MRNGPVRFDVNTHSLLSVLNRNTNLDAAQTLNMHTAVRDQTAVPKLFITPVTTPAESVSV